MKQLICTLTFILLTLTKGYGQVEIDDQKCVLSYNDQSRNILNWGITRFNYEINMQTLSAMSFYLKKNVNDITCFYSINNMVSNVPDSLSYHVNLHDKNKSYMVYTHINPGYIPVEDHFVESRDTLKLAFADSLAYSYKSRRYVMYKFTASHNADNYTVYFSDTLGLMKQYSSTEGHTFELFRGTYQICERYKFIDFYFNVLKNNDAFHTRADGKPRFVTYKLIDSRELKKLPLIKKIPGEYYKSCPQGTDGNTGYLVLKLKKNGRFVQTAKTTNNGKKSITKTNGAWALNNDTLILQPEKVSFSYNRQTFNCEGNNGKEDFFCNTSVFLCRNGSLLSAAPGIAYIKK